jgi:hypothetical protein
MLRIGTQALGYANMRRVRVAVLLMCALAGGCATTLGPEVPAGVDLSGSWKLDVAASDDPQKILEQMRKDAIKILMRRPQQYAPMPGERGAAGTPEAMQANGSYEEPPPPEMPHGDPLRRSPMAHVIQDTVARGEFLSVRQGPGEFVLDYGTTRRSFTPGARSVVSMFNGVGDQTSGWKGHEYYIQVRGQLGPDVTEEYSLSGDGRQLVAKLHVNAGELPAVNYTRIYNRSREVAPRQLPTND